MGLVVVYDACVLFPAPLRDTLLRVAAKHLVQARWTERILDETFRSILEQRPDLKPEQLVRTRSVMNEAFPDALVRGFEHREAELTLPDLDDRHVLAAALEAGASVIVTNNLKDFPSHALGPLRVEARHPDEFLNGLVEYAPGPMLTAVQEQAAALKRPAQTVEELLGTLRRCGLVRTVTRLQDLIRDTGA